MKLKDFIDYHATRPDDKIVDVFGIDSKRWDEIGEAVATAYEVGKSVTEAAKFLDNHFPPQDQKEAIGMFYILGVFHGRTGAEDWIDENGQERIPMARVMRMTQAATWLRNKNIEVPGKLQNLGISGAIRNLIQNFILRNDSHIEVSSDETDADSPFTNKNKFKKGGFNIPDPNKPGEEGPKEENT